MRVVLSKDVVEVIEMIVDLFSWPQPEGESVVRFLHLFSQRRQDHFLANLVENRESHTLFTEGQIVSEKGHKRKHWIREVEGTRRVVFYHSERTSKNGKSQPIFMWKRSR
jgi:hypothetical protein